MKVAGDQRFQSLPDEKKSDVRNKYFDEFVAPQVPTKDVEWVRDEFNSVATSTEAEIVLHLASRHPGNAGKYNESNPGVGVRIPLTDDTSFGAGTYRNSLDRQSNYAGLIHKIMQVGPVSIGAAGGLISGYQDKPVPFLMPEASMKVGPGTVKVNVVPPVKIGGNRVDPAIGVSYGIPFKK